MEANTIAIISPSLELNPTENHDDWDQACVQLATSLMPDKFPYGLAHLVVDPVLFATFPLNIDNADPLNPEPIDPPNPQEPPAPAGGAGGGTVAIYKNAYATYQEF